MRTILLIISVFMTVASACCNVSETLLIKGGTVYDGSGCPPVKADVLIGDGTILAVGDNITGKFKCLARKAPVIDATGLVVAPGFIDPHSHINRGLVLEESKDGECYLRMGVTTVLCGVCGTSPIPLSSETDKLSQNGTGLNIGYFVGLGSVRKTVIGSEDREPSAAELEKMKSLVREGMEWGAFGVSSGLIYNPGIFAKTDELIALTSVAAEYDGIYTTHMRYENENILEAMDETLRIGREAGTDVNVSHIKCAGTKAHGLSSEVISRIENARKTGLHVTADQYPYMASSTSLSSTVLPAWARGSVEKRNRLFNNPDTLKLIKDAIRSRLAISRNGANLVISPVWKEEEIRGKSVAQLALEWGVKPEDAIIRIFRKSSPKIVHHSMAEEDLRNYMVQPWVMTGTDGEQVSNHPRSRGTFTRKIRKYVNEDHLITLDDMIRRSTGLVADTYGINGRGYLREGYWADVVVFDPATVRDNASFEHPADLSTGFRAVIVNGVKAVVNDEATGALAGTVIKRDNSSKVR